LLREDLRATDTKEGCASGDCGACTVVLSRPDGSHSHTVNSCIRMAHSAHGLKVTTACDLSADGKLHPVQQAMVDHHASQCGFCTPGFVMSLYDLYQRAAPFWMPLVPCTYTHDPKLSNPLPKERHLATTQTRITPCPIH